MLRDRHPDRFVLLGVHTHRYPSQRDDAAVRHALQRLHLRAPVANDRDWLAWRGYGVSAWPTTLVVDADGRLAARFAGEARASEIEDVVLRLQQGTAAGSGGAGVVAADAPSGDVAEALAYPSHALATATRLFVSDTGHHRVLECALEVREGGLDVPGLGRGEPPDTRRDGQSRRTSERPSELAELTGQGVGFA